MLIKIRLYTCNIANLRQFSPLWILVVTFAYNGLEPPCWSLLIIWYLAKALLSCAIQNLRPHQCCLDHPASILPAECGIDRLAVDPAIISSLDLDVARHVVVNPLYAHLSGAVGISGNFVHWIHSQSSRQLKTGHQGSEMTLYIATPKHLRILKT